MIDVDVLLHINLFARGCDKMVKLQKVLENGVERYEDYVKENMNENTYQIANIAIEEDSTFSEISEKVQQKGRLNRNELKNIYEWKTGRTWSNDINEEYLKNIEYIISKHKECEETNEKQVKNRFNEFFEENY